jgi:hypothetical protein
VHADIFEGQAEEPSFSVFVFYAMIERSLQAGSDVSGFMYLSEHEAQQLVHRMLDLPNMSPISDSSPATWHDWGLVWGPVHQAALERIKEMGI